MKLDRDLAEINPSDEIHQVKETFGDLRYHSSLDDDPAAQVLVAAAKRSVANKE